MSGNKAFKPFDLKTIYAPTPGTKFLSLVIHLEDWQIYAGMIINEKQRVVCRRLFKRMAKGPIVKIHVARWVKVV